jgi:hypothetical protein
LEHRDNGTVGIHIIVRKQRDPISGRYEADERARTSAFWLARSDGRNSDRVRSGLSGWADCRGDARVVRSAIPIFAQVLATPCEGAVDLARLGKQKAGIARLLGGSRQKLNRAPT